MCLICMRLFKTTTKKKVCISQGDGKQRRDAFYNIACASAFTAKYNSLPIGGFLYYSF